MVRRKPLSDEYLKDLMLVDTTERWIAHDEVVDILCKYCNGEFSNKFSQIKRDYKTLGHGFRCEPCKKHNNQMERLRKKTPKYVTSKMEELDIFNINEFLEIKELQFGGWIMKMEDFVSSDVMITAKCVCGTEKEVNRKSVYLGNSRSCGCLKKELTEEFCLRELGVRHIAQLDSVKKKREATMIKEHGVKHALQNKEIFNDMLDNNEKKYGVRSPMMIPGAKEKAKKTWIKNHGVDHPMKSPKVKAARVLNNIIVHGVVNPSMLQEVKDKVVSKNQENLGRDHFLGGPEGQKIKEEYWTRTEGEGITNPGQVEWVKQKGIAKNMEVRGVPYAASCPIVKMKMLKTKIENDYSSASELELKEWIKSNFDVEVSKSYIGGSNPKEIDILIKKDGINILAIEYNGDYWHSEANKRVDHRYHKYKTEQVRIQKKCQLIHIFDSEWQTKKDIVKGFIRSKLEKGISVRSSKCEVREVSWEDTKEFCDNYHLQGKPQHSKLSLGLYHKDELISLVTFSKPHRQNMGSEYHLSRYAIKYGYRIHGGLSRLSKHAHKKIGDFITFVHLRLSSGDSYIKAGYDHIGDVRPDYWYWDISKSKIVSKQSRRKSKADTPQGMTEREHAEMDGLYRIWDCGKKKYIFRG